MLGKKHHSQTSAEGKLNGMAGDTQTDASNHTACIQRHANMAWGSQPHHLTCNMASADRKASERASKEASEQGSKEVRKQINQEASQEARKPRSKEARRQASNACKTTMHNNACAAVHALQFMHNNACPTAAQKLPQNCSIQCPKSPD